jgi:hypothetical protein
VYAGDLDAHAGVRILSVEAEPMKKNEVVWREKATLKTQKRQKKNIVNDIFTLYHKLTETNSLKRFKLTKLTRLRAFPHTP